MSYSYGRLEFRVATGGKMVRAVVSSDREAKDDLCWWQPGIYRELSSDYGAVVLADSS